MRPAKKLREFGLVLGALQLPFFTAHIRITPRRRYRPPDIIDKLGATDGIAPDIDIAALKQQAADQVKAKADAQQGQAAVDRPAVHPN